MLVLVVLLYLPNDFFTISIFERNLKPVEYLRDLKVFSRVSPSLYTLRPSKLSLKLLNGTAMPVCQ